MSHRSGKSLRGYGSTRLLSQTALLGCLSISVAACSAGMARLDEAALTGVLPAQQGGQPTQVAQAYPQAAAPGSYPTYVDPMTTASVVSAAPVPGQFQQNVLPPVPQRVATIRPSTNTLAGAVRPQGVVGAAFPRPVVQPQLASPQPVYQPQLVARAPQIAQPQIAQPMAQPVFNAPAPVAPSPNIASQPFPSAATTTGSVRTTPLSVLKSARVGLGNQARRAASVFGGTTDLNRQPAPQPLVTAKASNRLVPSAPAAVRPSQVQLPPVPQAQNNIVTGSVPAQLAPRATAPTLPVSSATGRSWQGWNATGGTAITVREGETVYNISRRYGVPPKALLGVNGLSSDRDLQAGSQIIIPVYQFDRQAGVSAPDADAGTQSASSATGWKLKLPASVAPPRSAPIYTASIAPNSSVGLPPVTQTANVPQPYQRPQRQVASAPAAVAPAAAVSGGAYRVVSGDTVSAIARRNGVSSAALMQANGMKNSSLRVGQQLVIPGVSTPVAKQQTFASTPQNKLPANNGAVVASRNGVDPTTTASVKPIINSSNAQSPNATGISGMRWPVRGRIVTPFGATVNGKRNDGIDISVPEGTSVKAAENGVVLYAGNELEGFGNLVLLKHENGLVTAYAHNSSLNVKRGQKVGRGQSIARAGRTGDADAPKLHFEVRKNSVPVNPLTYLGG